LRFRAIFITRAGFLAFFRFQCAAPEPCRPSLGPALTAKIILQPVRSGLSQRRAVALEPTRRTARRPPPRCGHGRPCALAPRVIQAGALQHLRCFDHRGIKKERVLIYLYTMSVSIKLHRKIKVRKFVLGRLRLQRWPFKRRQFMGRLKARCIALGP